MFILNFLKFKINKVKSLPRGKGFTIIELLVVIFIFALISGLVIFNYKGFRSDVSIENLAQDIALSIRRAQVYSVSTKSADTIVNDIFPSYGIHFEIPGTIAITGTAKDFIFFADAPPPGLPVADGQYNQSNTNSSSCGKVFQSTTAQDECMEIIKITSADKIVEICADGVCSDEKKNPSVDIVFKRPDTEARFCFTDINNVCTNPSNVTIKIESASKTQRSIEVWSTGQINVK